MGVGAVKTQVIDGGGFRCVWGHGRLGSSTLRQAVTIDLAIGPLQEYPGA